MLWYKKIILIDLKMFLIIPNFKVIYFLNLEKKYILVKSDMNRCNLYKFLMKIIIISIFR